MSARRFLLLASLILIGLQSPPAKAGLLSAIAEGLELIDSDLRSVCARALGSIRGSRMKKDVTAAIQEGQAEQLATVGPETARILWYQVYGLALANTYNQKFIDDLLKTDDKLFALNGRLVRLRPVDGSVALVPEILEGFLREIKTLDFENFHKIRLSWAKQNVFPSRPDLEKIDPRLLAGFHSSWSKRDKNFVYNVQIQAKIIDQQRRTRRDGGFFDLEIIFKPELTELRLSERIGHPTDKIYVDAREQYIALMKETAIGMLFENINTGKPLILSKGPETSGYFRRFDDLILDFMFFY